MHLGGRPSLPAPETTSGTLSILWRRQHKRCLCILALALSWFAVSAAAAGPPYAFTAPAVEVRTNSVKLMAMVVPNGLNSQAWFEWGLVGTMTNRTPATNAGAGFNVVLVTSRFTGLAPLQQYECRVVVSNAPGIVSGAVQRFATRSQLAAWGDSQYTKTEIPTGLAACLT